MTPDFRIHDPDVGAMIVWKNRARTNPERHFHESWEILYIVSGERTFFHANRTLTIKAGDFLCIRPGVLHRSINRKDGTCELFTLNFFPSSSPFFLNLVPLLNACGTPENPVIPIREVDRYRLTSTFFAIGRELEQKQPGYIPMFWGLVYQFIVELIRYIPVFASSEAEPLINRKAALVIKYLSEHYREEVSLSEVAKAFSMGETALSRMFRQATRFTFIEYLNTLRIQEACRLLSTTDKSVGEISELCGFGSVTQFGRYFRRISGNSPLSWRKKHRQAYVIG